MGIEDWRLWIGDCGFGFVFFFYFIIFHSSMPILIYINFIYFFDTNALLKLFQLSIYPHVNFYLIFYLEHFLIN